MRTILLALGVSSVVALNAQVTFENVSTAAGLTYQGRSWGSSWGDINGDGFVDLFMSCHQHQYEPYFDNDSIQIFVNTGDGHFDGTIYTLDDGGQSDIHGGVFFDQDNDGDKDMFIVTGGIRYEIFFRNDGGTHLEDIADQVNLIFENARGRQTTCVDVNNDGLTDLLINNQRVDNPPGQGSVLMLADQASGFIKDTTSGFNDPQSRVSIISDLNGDGHTDICVVNGTYLKIYSVTQDGQFTEEAQLDISNIGDVSIADFNGDLLPDIFVARGIQHETDIQLFNDSAIHASCNVRGNTPPCTARFRTEGPITVKMSLEDYRAFNIHIGNDSVITDVEDRQTFTLYPSTAQGFQDPLSFPGGVNCSFGYLPDSSWKVEVAKTGPGGNSVLMEITSNSPITNFTSNRYAADGFYRA
ncbi:MAG: VCBS repeat-containing protein [Flavobacteriales bacterium]|nr:VCBS repeat-containing protein [Flavobacteriales bacterium]